MEASDGPKDQFSSTMIQHFRHENCEFRHVTVEGLHHVHLNRPERVNRVVLEFIQKYTKICSKL